MVNKKRQVKNRKGSTKDEQGKQKAQSKGELISEDSHQQSKVSQESNEEKDNVQGSSSRPRSGKMLRREPNSPVELMMSPECVETFKKAGWLGYFQCLRGYHTEIALAFARLFDGHEATIGVVTLFVSKVSIAELGRLQLGGKRIQKDKNESAEDKQVQSEENIGKCSVRTRPSNKLCLKGKMMMNPKIKNDELIFLDSDQSPSKVHVDESKKKRKTILNDETVEKLQKVSVHKRKTKKKVKAKSSSGNKMLKRKLVFKDHELASRKGETLDGLDVTSDEVLKEPDHEEIQGFLSSVRKLASSDTDECSKKQDDLQKQKGKKVYVEDLAKEIKQIEVEEKVETDEKNLKQKMKEWMALLAEEKGKDGDSKAARIYGKLINMGHLAEELTWILETAVKTNVQAKFQDVKDSKETKGKKVDHI